MTYASTSLRFTGAHILRDTDLTADEVSVDGATLSDGGGQPIDLKGYLIMPGIIDLHGDAFEHHIAPRPTAPFPIAMGLAGTDKDAAANGVTTAWMAQSWSWEGGHRGPDFAEEFLTAHQAYRPRMMTDLRVQIRCETHTMDTQDRLIKAVRDFGIDYVIFNNHLEDAIETAAAYPDRFHAWAARANRTSEEHLAIVHKAMERSGEVPRYLCNMATVFDNLGVKYGSHDDTDGQTRERFSMIGAKICEFPTHISAAALAQTWGDPVLMGAPNVVRGGSQAGNISAALLIREGLCDALVSDYHYPTLAQAAFRLADDGLASLPVAWSMISKRPAEIMGLSDRGEIAKGKRADLTFLNGETFQIEGTMVAGRWSYLSGALAMRLGASTHITPSAEIAAE